jgi:hypothetical protein
VLVRDDLSVTYRGVQGTHSVASFYENGGHPGWHNETIIQLAVRNEKELRYWAEKLAMKGKRFSYFTEPDLKGQMTSIACVDTGEVFKRLPLSK